MTPVDCMVTHNPPNSYGDCVRACIATMLDLPSADVPHFAHDNAPGDVVYQRIRDWMAPRGYMPFWVNFPDEPLDSVLSYIGTLNPDVTYMLYGSSGTGDHVVVCYGGCVVHNPQWGGPLSLAGPGSHGFWSTMVITRL